jgi:hypothetical protein
VQTGELLVKDFLPDLLSAAEHQTLSPENLKMISDGLPTLGAKLSQPLLEKLALFLSESAPEDARGFLALAAAIYREDDPTRKQVQAYLELARKADEDIAAGNRQDLLNLARQPGDEGTKLILSGRLKKLIASGSADATDPYAEIRSLAELSQVFDDEQIPVVTERLLTEVNQGLLSGALGYEQWPFDETDVKALLRRTEQFKPNVKSVLADIYDRRIRSLVQANQADDLSDSYSRLLEYRPDPNPANDELRLSIILNAKDKDVRQFAMGRLEELKYSGHLGKMDKIRILFKGYYGRGLAVFFIASFVIILLCAALMMIRPMFVAGVSDAIAKAEERKAAANNQAHASAYAKQKAGAVRAADGGKVPRSESPEMSKKPFFKKEKAVSGYARGPVEKDEYSKLLEFLGLDDEASESEIKRAYRERVKSLHPDAKPGEVNTQDQDFIELKEVYDRILQIRGSWFGGRR